MIRPSNDRWPFLAVASILAIIGVAAYTVNLACEIVQFMEE